MDGQRGQTLKFVPLSIILRHDISRKAGYAYEYHDQTVTLVPSSISLRSERVKNFLQCEYCARENALEVAERTYLILSHDVLKKPENKWVVQGLSWRILLNFDGVFTALGLYLLFLLPLMEQRLLALGNHVFWVDAVLSILFAAAVRAVVVRWKLRTRSVILGLDTRPSRFALALTRVEGGGLYRCITFIGGAGGSLEHWFFVPGVGVPLRTDQIAPNVQPIRKEFEKLVFGAGNSKGVETVTKTYYACPIGLNRGAFGGGGRIAGEMLDELAPLTDPSPQAWAILSCKGCHNVYKIGDNAVAVSLEVAAELTGRAVIFGGACPSEREDLVSTLKDVPLRDVQAARNRARPHWDAIRAGIAGGGSRRWQCGACKTSNPYPPLEAPNLLTTDRETSEDSDRVAFHQAIWLGDLRTLERDLKANPGVVSSRDQRGRMALHVAANWWNSRTRRDLSACERVTRLLLSHGADVNARDNDGRTPLHLAVESLEREFAAGGYGSAKTLLAHGADVNAKDDDGATPLHVAAYRRNPMSAELLLASGADVDARDNSGGTPLHCAASAGPETAVADLLRTNKANIHAKDNDGRTPLHRAMNRDEAEGMVFFLCFSGANVNAQDNEGSTPLDLASERGHWRVKKLLLEHGAKASAKREASLSVGLLFADALTGDLEMIKAKLAENPELVSSKVGGRTALHFAVVGGNKDVGQCLLASKAEVNARDDGGDTPLHLAASAGRTEMTQLLLAYHARLDARNMDGSTPLHLAVSGGHRDVSALLLASGADVNATAKEGWTPLHLAVLRGHNDLAALLVANKADVNAEHRPGMTPLRIALEKRDDEAIQFLTRHGGFG
jgi:ankyrin repeat protein